MRIAVCDDDQSSLSCLRAVLERCSFVNEIEAYSDITGFFSSLEAGERYDLVLMDLDWGGRETGLAHAEKLYQTVPYLPVIYVTGFNDRFAQHILLQQTNLVGYLTKPVDEVLLERYLKKVQERRSLVQSLTFAHRGGLVSVDTARIICLESRNHVTAVVMDTVTYEVYEKLSDLFARLPDSFVRCHKSYAVNMAWVQRLNQGSILLKNGVEVGVSRTYRATTREKLFHFMGLQI